MELETVAKVVGKTYAFVAEDAIHSHERLIRNLIENKRVPQTGWDDATIEYFMQRVSMMDSNNFIGRVGLGEREARIASDLVSRIHFRLGHGVGRSGDIAAIQPKAAGSSLLARVAEGMMLHLLQACGMQRAKACIILPIATGMSIVMCLLTLKQKRPTAKYVVWLRIDQKTCFKAINTTGFIPIVVDGILEGDAIASNIVELKRVLDEIPEEEITCVITTTSCFAPREMDRVEEVSVICKEKNVPHLINNAYGVQCSKCMHAVNEAMRVGRVDAVVQSTDKNFMVPVGGGVVCSQDKDFITHISKTYPGRASSAPVIDIFITLLSLGLDKYKNMVKDRKRLFIYLRDKLSKVAEKHGERVLSVKNNPISLAMTLTHVEKVLAADGKEVTAFGSTLFLKRVSGVRVVSTKATKELCGTTFKGYGAHHDDYPYAYMTAASAIGLTEDEVDVFAQRLDAALTKVHTKKKVKKENSEDVTTSTHPATMSSSQTTTTTTAATFLAS
eukprot:m.62429 g.62429  ORF g.62429 m.62429 type:complete len:502 (-) comp8030_c3_seq3:1882-3387(-)